MHITYFGHSCFQIKIGDTHILFDPYITQNPLASSIDMNSIQVNYILVSHAHNDHIADVISVAQKNNATVIAMYEVATWFNNKGVENVIKLNIGGSAHLAFGKVKMVNAVHSSVFPDGAYGGNPAGFYITTNEKNFYYAGDTALCHDMKILGKYNHVDFAFLPIGDTFTMGVDDALIASKFIKCDAVIGMHYDTFPSIKIDHEMSKKKFESEEKKLVLLKIGETIQI